MNRDTKTRDSRHDRSYHSDENSDQRPSKRRAASPTSAAPSGGSGGGGGGTAPPYQNPSYKTLVLSHIDDNLSDIDITAIIRRDFLKFGTFNVSITVNRRRLAYINFKCAEDARDARHAMHDRLDPQFGNLVRMDAVYDHAKSTPSGGYARGGSDAAPRGSQPPPRGPQGSAAHENMGGSSGGGKYRDVSPRDGRSTTGRYESKSGDDAIMRRGGSPLPLQNSRDGGGFATAGQRGGSQRFYDGGDRFDGSKYDLRYDTPRFDSRFDDAHRFEGAAGGPAPPPRHDFPPTESSSYQDTNRRNSVPLPPLPSPKFDSGGGAMDRRGSDRFGRTLYPEDDESATRTLFVGNMEADISDAELRRAFQRFGFIEDVDIKRNAGGPFWGGQRGPPPRGGGPGGGNSYAFVRFWNLDMAHDAKMEMCGQCIRSLRCKIGYGKPTPSPVVWVGGLGPWVSREEAKREISRMAEGARGGSVLAFDWPQGRGYAYATFGGVEAAAEAMRAIRGREVGGAGHRIRVDFADPAQVGCDEPAGAPMNDSGNGGYDRRGSGNLDGDRISPHRGGEREISGGNPRNNRLHNATLRDSYEDRPGGTKRKRTSSFDDDGNGANGGGAGGKDSRGGGSSPNSFLSDTTTLAEVALRAPAIWCGALALKNSSFMTRMHVISGDSRFVSMYLSGGGREGAGGPPLKVGQRLRMDKLDEVRRRMNAAGSRGCAVLLALPLMSGGGRDEGDAGGGQRRPLKGLGTYLKAKDAAGIVTLEGGSGGGRGGGGTALLHVFPGCCEFAKGLIRERAPRLSSAECGGEDHLIVLVVRV